MKRWEYLIESYPLERSGFPRKVTDTALKTAGEDGWELIAVVPSGGDYYSFSWVFKRKIPDVNED